MHLYLARHGETTHNSAGVGLGRADVALTARGTRQAAALGRRMADVPLTRIVASPLSRAMETARAIAGERGLVVEPREELLELDVGETEGMPFPEMREKYGDFLKAWASDEGIGVRMPGGESLLDLDARLAPLLVELRAADDGHVAVVSHNFVTKVALCRLLELDLRSYRSLGADLASVTTLVVRDGRATCRRLNDTCHLESLEP